VVRPGGLVPLQPAEPIVHDAPTNDGDPRFRSAPESSDDDPRQARPEGDAA
jgi:hypothetical protein